MLKKETIEKMKVFKIDPEALITAIKDEKEVDFEIPDVQVLTVEELTTRDANKMTEGEKAAEPKVRGILIKEIGKKLNFEPKSERVGDLVAELQAQINKGGDEKVRTLQEQVNGLTKDKETLTAELDAQKTAAARASFESELIGYFPTTRGTDLTDRERLAIMNGAITFEQVDGKYVAKRGGETIKDAKTHAPLPVDQVVKGYFTERKWDVAAGGTGGRGAGDSGAGGGAGAKKYSEVEAAWKAENPNGNTLSPEFMDHVGKIAKENADFNWNE